MADISNKKSMFKDVLWVVAALAVVAITIGASQFFLEKIIRNEINATKVSINVIDMEKIIQQEMLNISLRVQKREIKPEDIPVETKLFTDALMGKINNYSKEGVIVLDSKAIVSVPSSVVDITKDVSTSLKEDGYLTPSP